MSSLSTMMQFPLTLRALIERAHRHFATVEVAGRLRSGRLERSTYGRLHGRIRHLAAGLQRAGLGRGDRVATLMWNDLRHLELYFGVPLAAGVVHPLNLRLHPETLARVVADAGDRFLVVDEELLPICDELLRQVRFERIWVCREEGSLLESGGWNDYEDLLGEGAADPGWQWPVLEENDAAAMGYTSGTTGDPKGVVYSHRALVLHALATALPDSMELKQSDTVLAVVPMFHANGWGIPYTATLVGCRQVYPGARPDAEILLDLMVGEQVSFSAGVPVVWERVLERLEQEASRWPLPPGLRINLGGSAAPESLFAGFDRHSVAINMGWGMTELTPVGAMNPRKTPAPDVPAELDADRTRQGLPLPLMEIRAVDGGGGEIAWDGVSTGELEIRGPWAAASYWGAREPESWRPDGWFRTGDVVNLDARGSIRIVDRQKDLIRSGGEWISSVALENCLATHPGVREAAVIAVDDARWQERPLAMVVLRAGMRVDADSLRAHLASRFASWQWPDRFVFVDEIPRTATGKLDKRRLRDQYRSPGGAARPGPTAPRTDSAAKAEESR